MAKVNSHHNLQHNFAYHCKDVERLFSTAKDLLSPEHNRLNPKNAEKILFCRTNLPLVNFRYWIHYLWVVHHTCLPMIYIVLWENKWWTLIPSYLHQFSFLMVPSDFFTVDSVRPIEDLQFRSKYFYFRRTMIVSAETLMSRPKQV